MNFISPSKGRLSFNQMFRDLLAFINEHPDDTYKMIVGTDSQERQDVYYVTAVVILREGKGGRFYYAKEKQKGQLSMKQRIFLEAARSLEVASRLAAKFMAVGKTDFNIEIHLDVGQQGRTKEIIREVVGMVTGSGFDARIKPDSYGATKVADKFTK
ncbi:ribonuclease H-like YkuK family protein [Capillibacterium thermochitinicola]|uniref:Ribonuclease H-like YkuK family protein n=1 Tax=Capillibacterium thermochitinicola TaxID=2699427 RepID=A0A8J6LRF4_9FIRM|nr:ribonuclease H-like YkuK family protein [Capillibacterium thermochitinicola]MBA2132032.1 ribonuclease H-like YkuK family protein [Capillibacterium thermochitinicola]